MNKKSRFHFVSRLFAFATVLAVSGVAVAQDDLFQPGDRVVFLGDSNTYASTYVNLLDAHVRQNHPDMDLELLNLGLGSETASGLSEPSHPWPRPDVRTRLDSVLEKTEPDVVFVCYGMNDAIYHPFDQKRFETFQEGIKEVVARIDEAGAKVILLTPPPFDPEPVRKAGKLKPADSDSFAWDGIFEDYDDVIRQYAAWEVKWANEHPEQVDWVIDIHTAFGNELAKRRESDPAFSCSTDGVHFDATGHRIFAEAMLKGIHQDVELDFDADYLKLVTDRQRLLRDAWLTHCGHDRPGVPEGKPLAEAEKDAAELETQIDAWLSK